MSNHTNDQTSPLNDTMSREDKILLEPYLHITRVPGKDFRSMLIDAFNVWLQVESSQIEKIKIIVSQLHNASLLIDDIEDNSTLRRGAPVAHSIYGIPTTINTANYVYFLALEATFQLGSHEATKVFVDEMLLLHRGQGMDIYWRDNCECPTEEQYLEMVLNKTGGLFRLSVGLMQAFSEFKTDLNPLLTLLGLLFQILDDYQNLQSEKYHTNKSFCEDFTEGKFSFPIIHAIRKSGPDDRRIFNILKQRTTDDNLKRYAIEIMKDMDSFSYTEARILDLYDQVTKVIREDLGGNPMLEKILSTLLKAAAFFSDLHAQKDATCNEQPKQ